MSTPPSAVPKSDVPGPLTQCLIMLAGTPDDEPGHELYLRAIAQLAADSVPAVHHASITMRRDGTHITVGTSSEVALAVDEAQYADGTGPCIAAIEDGVPQAVPDIGGAGDWPGFRDEAFRWGLRASLSIPLFAGRGRPIAALNLYGLDPAAMAPLVRAVWAAYDSAEPPGELGGLSDGDRRLIAGISGAFVCRAMIQQAIGILMGTTRLSAADAYAALRRRCTGGEGSLAISSAALIIESRFAEDGTDQISDRRRATAHE